MKGWVFIAAVWVVAILVVTRLCYVHLGWWGLAGSVVGFALVFGGMFKFFNQGMDP